MSVRYPTSSIESRVVRFGLVAADDGSSRLVYAMVVALIVIGVVLIVLAVVVFRRTRVDLDVLAPLERMGSKKWRKSDPESRRALLDAVRPAGASGPSPSEPEAAPVELPPPVIESVGESPHKATFVAGPDGVEPVEHVDGPETVEDAQPVGDLEPVGDPEPDVDPEPVEGAETADASLTVDDTATAPAESIEPAESDAASVAANESADAAVTPAEVVAVEGVPAEVVPVDEQTSGDPVAEPDEAHAAPDVPVAAPDEPVAPPDDEAATQEGGLPAPEFASDDSASPNDLVNGPTATVEPVDGSVTGQ